MQLVLRKDTLAELTTGELAAVRAGAPVPWTPSCPLLMKVTDLLSDNTC